MNLRERKKMEERKKTRVIVCVKNEDKKRKLVCWGHFQSST
jgi:hypothetical protein